MALGQRLAVPRRSESDGQDNDREEQQVDLAVQAQGLDLAVIGLDGGGVLRRVAHAVDRVVRQEQQHQDEQPLLPQRERPRERHAVQVAEEQRRVAERSQYAATVRHNEDREQDRVHAVLTFLVRLQERANQQHGRARRPNERGQEAADRQEDRVVTRGRLDVAGQVNAAGDHEQREEQRDELHVLHARGDKRAGARLHEHPDRRRYAEQERDGQLGGFLFPPVRGLRDDRQERDACEHRDEGEQAPPGVGHRPVLG
ncbi:Uncharacterised protein [Mycobacteroides abscessus subsp. abscessus]|nr:Uncharacterised protein [Mycobacteroides abscessus subsp. abscessus]